jgi:septal ring factor EnvC (AmiA/AmiB activator)
MIDEPTTRRVTERTKETIGQVADSTKQQADTQRERISTGIRQVADGLRQTGDVLSEHDQNLAGDYARKAAGQVERIAGYLQENSIEQIVGDVERFARREPALVLGGAFALGFLAARFLRAGAGSASRQPGYPALQNRPLSSGRMSNGQ